MVRMSEETPKHIFNNKYPSVSINLNDGTVIDLENVDFCIINKSMNFKPVEINGFPFLYNNHEYEFQITVKGFKVSIDTKKLKTRKNK